jgi:tRNA A37 threonylcarbamoyladenosine dehydratase
MHLPAVNSPVTIINAYFNNIGSIKVAVFTESIRSLNLESTIFCYLAHVRAVENVGRLECGRRVCILLDQY